MEAQSTRLATGHGGERGGGLALTAGRCEATRQLSRAHGGPVAERAVDVSGFYMWLRRLFTVCPEAQS